MKRLLLIFLLALSAAGLRAQELGVASMVQSTMDLSAATNQRLDLNGVPCALVKVLIPAGAEFEGNIIQPVEFRAGEHWVYVTAGTKQIRVKHPSAKPVQVVFADYGIPRLESKATYTLDISMPAGAQAQSAASGRNYVVFTLEPPTASVTIDGTPHEPRAGKVRVLLRQGTYDYTVEAPGYLPERGSVTIGAERVELTVRLRSSKGSLSVTSVTPGTEIYVNGEKMGSGSWQGELASGEYLVEGRLASHRPVEQLAQVAEGRRSSVALPALSAVTGSLNVDFEPDGATIAIDGTASGTVPAMIDGVLAGTRSVTISAPGYTPQTHSVTIADSQTATLSGSLKKTETALPFSLCAEAPDGSIVYFTADQWKNVPKKRSYKKRGIVVAAGGEKFLVELEDKEGGKKMTWTDALKYDLPTSEQGKIIVENEQALNNTLRAFGGVPMNRQYWTKTMEGPVHSAYAYYIGLDDTYNYHSVFHNNKSYLKWVRAVAPCP